MQFVLVIYHGTHPLPGSDAWNAMPEAEQQAIYADYGELNKTPGIALRLPPIAPGKATTVQLRDGEVQVKDGPHLTEGIGGAFVFEAENIDEAISLAARVPQARLGGAVEVRPVEQYF
jgi:hypothetical protein